jgi:16S rRNA (cytosine1402-N4)-methyltransferase
LTFHIPVLLQETLEILTPPSEGGILVDCTLGEGGHAEAFLSRWPNLFLLGVDADRQILERARKRLEAFQDRTMLVHCWFSEIFTSYPLERRPDLVLFDLGISMFHYSDSGRGFSFAKEEPLDMRLGDDLTLSAADIVNSFTEDELLKMLFSYGEEKHARRIVRAILRERQTEPIDTSTRLARIVSEAVPVEARYARIHPATRTFQALRIAVNDELDRLGKGLVGAFGLLQTGGRMGVISFHSLEDRIVKRFFQTKLRGCTCPPDWPICQCGGKPEIRLLARKPISPTEEEIGVNPPSRSARLRAAEKIA